MLATLLGAVLGFSIAVPFLPAFLPVAEANHVPGAPSQGHAAGAGGITTAQGRGTESGTEAPSSAVEPQGAGKSQEINTVEITCKILTTDTNKMGGCLVYLVDVTLYELSQQFLFFSGALTDAFMAISLSSEFTKQINFVDFGWVITRDIANTAFIFVLLYIAIMTILQAGGANTKQLLVRLIIAALLVNFSLFLTRFVIDVTNVVAIEFYNKIGTTDQSVVTIAGIEAKSITNGFLAINSQSLERDAVDASNGGHIAQAIAILLLGALLNVAAVFIFLTTAFLFLGRVVALWFVMIFAPLALVAMIVPVASGMWTQWKNTLTRQAIFAPIVLFFFYLAYALLNNVSALKTVAQPNTTGWTGDIVRMLVNVIIGTALGPIIVLAVMMFGLGIARDMSGKFGAAVDKYGKLGLGALIGTAATAGALAGRMGMRPFAKQAVDKNREEWEKSRFGRMKLAIAEMGAKGSYDVRGIGVGGATVGAGMQKAGLGFGKATPEIWKTSAERREAHIKEYNSLSSDEAKINYLTTRVLQGDRVSLWGAIPANERMRIAQSNLATEAQKEEFASYTAALVSSKRIEGRAEGIKRQDSAEVNFGALMGIKDDKERQRVFEEAGARRQAEMYHFAESDEKSRAVVNAMVENMKRENREALSKEILSSASDTFHIDKDTGERVVDRSAMRKKADFLSSISDEALRQRLYAQTAGRERVEILDDATIPEEQAAALKRLEEGLTPAQKEQTNKARQEAADIERKRKERTVREEAVKNVQAGTLSDIAKLGPKDVARELDPGIITDEKAVPYLNGSQIKAIANENRLTPDQQEKLKNNILGRMRTIRQKGGKFDTNLEQSLKVLLSRNFEDWIDRGERTEIDEALNPGQSQKQNQGG